MKLKLLILNLPLLLSLTINAQGIGQYDEYGWTVLEPSADSRIVYVSSSEGDDNNDGLSESTPKETIAAGDALIRDGFPDHLLLKRGDVFENVTLGRWKSGRSLSEPLVVSYYGENGDRPLIIITEAFIRLAARPRNHVAVVGLEFYKPTSNPDSPSFDNTNSTHGISLSSGSSAENWLIEDCKFRYTWLAAQGNVQNGTGFLQNVFIRRNIISRGWVHNSTTTHQNRIQGLYVNDIENLYIEENFFDHCGWNDQIEDANANQYNHNVYIQTTCFGDIIFKGNILMRGAAHGVQLRSGGIARHNVMINNAIGMNIGYNYAPAYNTEHTLVADNVVTDGRPQIPNDRTNPQTGALWGIWKQVIDNITVQDNIVANILDNRGGNIYPYRNYEDNNANAHGEGNIAWNWERNDFPESNNYTDSDRNIASFATTKSLNGIDGYSNLHLNRPIKTYTFELSAYEYLNYIREGFNKANDIVSDFTFTDNTTLDTDEENIDQLDFFPNPVSNRININSNNTYKYYQIYNLYGIKVASGKMKNNRINVKRLTSGIYQLVVYESREVFINKRFIKN